MNWNGWLVRLCTPKFWGLMFGLFLFLLLVLYFKMVSIYLLISLFITLLGRPIFDRIHGWKVGKLRISDTISALITILLFYVILLSFLALFIPIIINEVRILAEINPDALVEKFKEPLDEYSRTLQNYGLDVNLFESSRTYLRSTADRILNSIQLNDFVTLFLTLGDVIALIFSVSFITFFLLKDRTLIPTTFGLLLPKRAISRFSSILNDVRPLLRRYLFGIVLQITLVSITYLIGLSIVGLEHAFLIAFFAGIFNIIPYVGPFIGGAIIIVTAISTHINDTENLGSFLLGLVIVNVVVQFLDNNFFTPYIFSNSVKAHPLEIFLVILMGAKLGGIIGMILAVPIYTVIRIIAREFLPENAIVKKLTRHL